MKPPVIALTALLVPLLAGPGCAHRRDPTASLPIEPCALALDQVSQAPHAKAAREGIRGYLRCEISQDRTLPDLEDRVAQALRKNPYPATGREDLRAWFFDTSLLKAMPGRPADMHPTIERLEDQALARLAMGDADMARAARARADRLRQLVKVLEEVAG